jgi:hypothetical protein
MADIGDIIETVGRAIFHAGRLVIETVTQFSFDSKWGLRLLSAFFGAIGLWLVLAFKDNDRGEQTAGLIGGVVLLFVALALWIWSNYVKERF